MLKQQIKLYKRSPNCIKWQQVDIVKMTALMEQDAQQIMSDLHNTNDAAKLNMVSNQLSNVIYTACKNSYKATKKK